MFEKEAEEYAFDEVNHKQEWYIKHPERSIDEDYEDIKKTFKNAATFGYNKGKNEAKEIIKTFLGFAEAFGYSPSMDKFISEAKQFIEDSEVENDRRRGN